MMLRRWLALVCGALLLLAAACAPGLRARTPVTVASADTSEQLLIGQITVLMLRAEGYRVVDKTGLGNSEAVRTALKRGSADICWEYTGDVWSIYLGHDEPIADPYALHARVREEDALNRISWLTLAPMRRTMGLTMRRETAESWGIATTSDLSDYMRNRDPHVRLCAPRMHYEASYGIRGLERVYQLRFDEQRTRFGSVREGYEALGKNACDCALGFSNDTEIVDRGFVFLYDDRGFSQASNLAPAVRTPVLSELPTLEASLLRIGTYLDSETLAALQREMRDEKQRPAAVAQRFLTERGAIGRKRTAPDGKQ